MTTTIQDIKEQVAAGKLIESHTSYKRGYVSRKIDGIVSGYDGRFGKGFVVSAPCFKSTQFCYVTYYVEASK